MADHRWSGLIDDRTGTFEIVPRPRNYAIVCATISPEELNPAEAPNAPNRRTRHVAIAVVAVQARKPSDHAPPPLRRHKLARPHNDRIVARKPGMARTSEGRELIPGEGIRLLGKPHPMSTGSRVHVSQCGSVLADFKMIAVRSWSL